MILAKPSLTAADLIAFEAGIAACFNRGDIRAPVHLAGGNEEQLIGIFKDVRPEDWVACQWRSHYHALLHGVPRERVMAEILAGRSIAMCFPEHRFLSSAIAGGHLPIALGIAWSIKRRGGTERVWAFCGDMTAMGGMFHECLGYAVGHDLPIDFVVEDNRLSVCTDTAEVWGKIGLPAGAARYQYKLPWPHAGAGKRVQF